MENFFKITNSVELSKIFDAAQDKLVVLMFYTKHNPQCKRALNFFEKTAMNNNLSLFCVVDMDKFQGESRYVSNVTNMPKFEIFYLGNSLATQVTSDEKEIENIVRIGQQYIMSQCSSKNNNNMNQFGMFNQTPQMPLNPMQIQQLQQQILNNAQMQNPQYFQYLMQNPVALQNLVQQQIQQMQMARMQQQQITPPISISQQMPVTQMPQYVPPVSTVQSSQPIQTAMPSSSSLAVPTLQQMQQMFQIFQMMQQMGILNMQASPTTAESQTKATSQDNTDETIILPNGDKIIPLGNGKYGLIKKN